MHRDYIIVAVLGIVVLLFGCYRLKAEAVYRLNSIQARATVQVTEPDEVMSSWRRKTAVCHYQLRLPARDMLPSYIATTTIVGAECRPHGATLNVRYDPASPHDVRLAGPGDEKEYGVPLIVFGAAMLLLDGLALMIARRLRST